MSETDCLGECFQNCCNERMFLEMPTFYEIKIPLFGKPLATFIQISSFL